VQRGDHTRHLLVNRPPLGARHLGQRGIPKQPPLDVVHHVELRADHRGVAAQGIRLRHRHLGIAERDDHPELAIDGVGGRQQLAGRFTPQHIAVVGGLHQERGVGLSTRKLLHLDGSDESRDVRLHPGGEPRRVEGVLRGRRPQSRGRTAHMLDAPPSTAMY
jgi:hypothetical protein